MKWQIWKRNPNKIRTVVVDPNGPFTLNWIWPQKPLEMTHTIIHTPYPRPETINIRFQSRQGRQWMQPPIYCRGGTHYPINMPPQYEDDPWQSMDIDVRYE